MWTQKLVTRITRYRGHLAIIVMLLLAASSIGAQPTELTALTGIRVQMGLMNTFTGGGRSIAVNVSEGGARNAESMVRIDFTDATGRVISTGEGRLTPTQPVTHELLLDTTLPRMLVGAKVTFVRERGLRSAPMVVVEDIDPVSSSITTRGLCSPPAWPQGAVIPMCDGGTVTDFVVGR